MKAAKIIISIVCVLTMLNCFVTNALYVKADEIDAEVQKAIDLSLTPENLALPTCLDDPITYPDYCLMIRRIINNYNPEKLSEWDELVKDIMASDKAITKGDAIMAIYEAAVVMDEGKVANGIVEVYPQSPDGIVNNLENKYDCWSNSEDTAPFETSAGTKTFYPFYRAAYLYAMQEYSLVNMKPVFERDSSDGSINVDNAFTVKEAIHSVIRFYEADFVKCSADKKTEIAAAVQNRIDEIADSNSDIVKADTAVAGASYSGTAYYVSSSEGDDDNDGLSPEKPFKTLDRVHSQAYVNNNPLKSGDAVFFKRGDVWRGETYICVEGVVYSAYGVGDKPKFYGSMESGASSDKWELAYEGNKGEKIWKFYKDITDVGGIIFNNGSSWANRVYNWWSVEKQNYVVFDDPGSIFNYKTQLSDDLDFCCMIYYSGREYPISRYILNYAGLLYLRCDSGNPGSIYTEIEFETTNKENDWMPIFRAKQNCTLDNLSILYFGDLGIGSVGSSGSNSLSTENIYVQNCEIGYGGNSVLNYKSETPGTDGFMAGDGISGVFNNCVVKNCYCHDIDGNAITAESAGVSVSLAGTVTYTNNVVVRCGQGISVQDWNHSIKAGTINISDNIAANIGEGYVHGCFCPYVAYSLEGVTVDGYSDGIVFKNNLAYCENARLMRTSYSNSSVDLKSENCEFYHRTETTCDHDFEEIDIIADFEKAGYYTKKCKKCGNEKDYVYRPILKKGINSCDEIGLEHNYVISEEKTVSCTTDGYIKSVCTICGKEKTENFKEALGHDFGSEWIVDVEPGYESQGSKSHHCSRCDAKSDITTIPKTGYPIYARLYSDSRYEVEVRDLGGFVDVEDIETRLSGEQGYIALYPQGKWSIDKVPELTLASGISICGDGNNTPVEYTGNTINLSCDLMLVNVPFILKQEQVELIDNDHNFIINDSSISGKKLTAVNSSITTANLSYINLNIDGVDNMYVGQLKNITPKGDDDYDCEMEYYCNLVVNGSISGVNVLNIYQDNIYINDGSLSVDNATGLLGNVFLRKTGNDLASFEVKNSMKNMLWHIKLYAYDDLYDECVEENNWLLTKNLLTISEGTVIAHIGDDESCREKMGFMFFFSDDFDNFNKKTVENGKLIYKSVESSDESKKDADGSAQTPTGTEEKKEDGSAQTPTGTEGKKEDGSAQTPTGAEEKKEDSSTQTPGDNKTGNTTTTINIKNKKTYKKSYKIK